MNTKVKLNAGTEMPLIGLGTVNDLGDDDLTVAAIVSALRAGYRCLDTASIYKNEHLVGRALRESGVPREDIFLITKVWNEDIRQDRVAAAFDESLERLGVESVDLYLVHWPIEGKVQESWRQMEAIHASGRARAIGVCNFHEHHLDQIVPGAAVVPAINQIELHPWLQQRALRARCAELGIAVQAWRPLGKGALLEDPVVTSIAEKHSRTPAQIALRWSAQLGVAVIPKSVNPERIASNLAIFDFALDDADLAALAGLDAGRRLGGDPDNFDF